MMIHTGKLLNNFVVQNKTLARTMVGRPRVRVSFLELDANDRMDNQLLVKVVKAPYDLNAIEQRNGVNR